MKDYILFMHADAVAPPSPDQWHAYFTRLRESGAFQGGSSIGSGEVLRRNGAAAAIADHLIGYIRVRAENIEAAGTLVTGNPVYENGGSVEIRELPAD